MHFWNAFRSKLTQAWERSDVFLLALCLTAGPMAVALYEFRTLPLDGYLPARNAWIWFAVAAVGFLLLAGRLPVTWRLPLWIVVPAGIGLFFNDSPLWLTFLAATVIVTLLAHGLSKFSQSTWLLERAPAFLVGSGVLCLSGYLYDNWFTGFDVQKPVNVLLNIFFPTLVGGKMDGTLTIQNDSRYDLITMTWDRMGGVYALALLLLLMAFGALRKLSAARRLTDVAIFLVYLVIAGFIRILGTSGLPETSWFDEYAIGYSFLPLALLMAVRLAHPPQPNETAPIASSRWRPVAAFAGALLFVAGYTLWSPSKPKPGIVAIDEFHSAWEPMNQVMDERTFGTLTVYNYTLLYKEIDRVFKAKKIDKEMTAQDLDGVAVLILKTPTLPYSKAFCDLVEKFVRDGGGLWLVGDHTDAFGMSTYLNDIAARFKLGFQKNAFIEPPYKRNLWKPTPYSDPIVGGLDTFLFYTGCTLTAPILDKKLMVGHRMVVEDADYAAGSFFGELRPIPQNPGGNVIMASAGERGRGRVAMWSDSTLFSNFAIDTPGKLPLIFNTVEWLRHSTDLPWFRVTLCLLGGALFLVAAVGKHQEGMVLAVALAVAATPVFERLNSGRQRWWTQEEVLHGPTICYYEPMKTMHYAVYISIDKAGPEHYNSAFLAARRVGMQAYYSHDFSQKDTYNAVVIIPEPHSFKDAQIRELAAWVSNGGKLIVLDSLRDSGQTTDKLFSYLNQVSPFLREKGNTKAPASNGLVPEMVTEVEIRDIYKNNLGKELCTPLRAPSTASLFTVEKNEPIAGEFKVGKGSIFLSSTVTGFSDDSVGDVHATPLPQQRAFLELLFSWYKSSQRPASPGAPETAQKTSFGG